MVVMMLVISTGRLACMVGVLAKFEPTRHLAEATGPGHQEGQSHLEELIHLG